MRALPERRDDRTDLENRTANPARETRRRFAWLGAILLFASPVPAIGQIAASAPVAVGTPLRVTRIDGSRQAARFESQSAAGLQVRIKCDSGCERLATTAWKDLRQVDAVVRGPGSTKHAILGGLIGGAVTYVVMFAVARNSSCTWDAGSCPVVGVAELSPGIVSGGTVLGALLGWTTSRDRWETVWPSGAPRDSR